MNRKCRRSSEMGDCSVLLTWAAGMDFCQIETALSGGFVSINCRMAGAFPAFASNAVVGTTGTAGCMDVMYDPVIVILSRLNGALGLDQPRSDQVAGSQSSQSASGSESVAGRPYPRYLGDSMFPDGFKTHGSRSAGFHSASKCSSISCTVCAPFHSLMSTRKAARMRSGALLPEASAKLNWMASKR